MAHETLYPAAQISQRVRELGAEIGRDHPDDRPLLVAVLKGSTIFLSDLLRAIPVTVEVDMIAITSFSGAIDRGGRVRILKDLDTDVAGRDVILVEDLIDTGLTAAYLMNTLRSRGAASVQLCTLLDRSVRRIAPIEVRYAGFDCPDRFVVGYGMDHQERFRTLHAIYAVDDPASVDEAALLAEDRGLPVPETVATVEP